MKKHLFFAVLAFMIHIGVNGQQDAMFSQYLFNGVAINPAYAGSKGALQLTGLFRQQWVGISGAPRTQTFSAHLPSPNLKHGFGFSMTNDQISFLGQTLFHADYAHRINFEKGSLALGLRGSLINYRINWGDSQLKNQNDQVLLTYGQNLFLPNAGFGVYYHSNKFFGGFSIPHLLVNTLDSNNPVTVIDQSVENKASFRRHYFGYAGVLLPVAPDVNLKPSMLVKYVQAAPVEFDLNLSAYFFDKFGIGGSYRTGDGIVFLLEYWFNDQFRAGYAYDYPLSRLRMFSSGSHELVVSYTFEYSRDEIVSPRVF